MKILVIFGSQRTGGKNADIEINMKRYSADFEFDFVHMADHEIAGCDSCLSCQKTGRCIKPTSESDRFQELFEKMQLADAIFIISPVYAVIPSKLTALFERLTSVLFFGGMINTDRNPLLGKKAAIFCYCSSGVCNDSYIKLIFDKFVMKDYRFDQTTYGYLNSIKNPEERYSDVTDYVTDTLKLLKQKG